MGIFSKIFNSFKSIRINDKNGLTGAALNHLLIGSMYAEQQSAFLNSYETGLDKDAVSVLVETYWEIYNKKDAVEILHSLQYANQDNNIDIVYQAFEDEANYAEILKSNLPSEESVFEDYVSLYRKLKSVVPELIEQKVVADFSLLKKTKDSGWNFGRGVFLSRCCYELAYLSENEIREYMANSYAGIKNYCSTWQEYTSSYIFGRAIWGGSNNSGMIQIAHDLLNNKKSPLKNNTYL
jgi:Protein of unknown function (DUF1266)